MFGETSLAIRFEQNLTVVGDSVASDGKQLARNSFGVGDDGGIIDPFVARGVPTIDSRVVGPPAFHAAIVDVDRAGMAERVEPGGRAVESGKAFDLPGASNPGWAEEHLQEFAVAPRLGVVGARKAGSGDDAAVGVEYLEEGAEVLTTIGAELDGGGGEQDRRLVGSC